MFVCMTPGDIPRIEVKVGWTVEVIGIRSDGDRANSVAFPCAMLEGGQTIGLTVRPNVGVVETVVFWCGGSTTSS